MPLRIRNLLRIITLGASYGEVAALRGKRPTDQQKCDGCSGDFIIANLHPCSCDMWLCSACLQKYLNPPPKLEGDKESL